MAETVRISQKSDRILQEITSFSGKSKVEVIEEALITFRHHQRMNLLNQSYNQLRKNKSAWKEELKERHDLEGTLTDGLEEKES